jgi:hypothetical protein
MSIWGWQEMAPTLCSRYLNSTANNLRCRRGTRIVWCVTGLLHPPWSSSRFLPGTSTRPHMCGSGLEDPSKAGWRRRAQRSGRRSGYQTAWGVLHTRAIGQEEKFVLWASKMLLWQHFFVSFDPMSLASGWKCGHYMNGNPNSPQEHKLFFPSLYKLHDLYILMDFYQVVQGPLDPLTVGRWPDMGTPWDASHYVWLTCHSFYVC